MLDQRMIDFNAGLCRTPKQCTAVDLLRKLDARSYAAGHPARLLRHAGRAWALVDRMLRPMRGADAITVALRRMDLARDWILCDGWRAEQLRAGRKAPDIESAAWRAMVEG